jgi:hypothetical protein
VFGVLERPTIVKHVLILRVTSVCGGFFARNGIVTTEKWPITGLTFKKFQHVAIYK